MCQLAAYIGDRPIAPLLMDCLRYQEGYFGGNATGLGVINNGSLSWIKESGPVDHVIQNSKIMGLTGTTGIAHSRLSLPNIIDARYNRAENAHPFINSASTIALMHNGIIANYETHWAKLAEDYAFKSYNPDINYITDSEVAVHLADQKLKEGMSLPDALRETANSLTGMVLLAAISVEEPETVYITNWIEACTLGKGDDETMFSSSSLGFQNVKEDFDVFTAPRNSFIKLTRDKIEISKLDANRKAPELKVNIDAFREEVTRVLTEKSPLYSLEILLMLDKGGGEKIFGITLEEWKAIQKLGWGDQNQIMDPLIQIAHEGAIKRCVEHRVEVGITVPRIIWSLP
ncbi:MAG: hypothetical protein NWE89_05670 [Candidatus Bathyarchaeota archaeon]|nr:hypothetical protein [Candidatus Bathyarchaeota archaeon]